MDANFQKAMRHLNRVRPFHSGVSRRSGGRNLVGYFLDGDGLVGMSESEPSEGNAPSENGEAISMRRIPAQRR